MPDYKPFQKTTWGIRDWHALEEMIEQFWYFSTTPLEPEQNLLLDTITVPTGLKFHYTEYYVSTQFDGLSRIEFPQTGAHFAIWVSAYKPDHESFSIPFIFAPGAIARIYIRNDDIVPGHYEVAGSVYRFPASSPEKPKSDDPEEIMRVRDFNYLSSTILPDGTQLKIFSKIREDRKHFLRIKDFGTKNQKVIAKGHLKPEEVNEIIETIKQRPEIVLKVLEKIEKNSKIK